MTKKKLIFVLTLLFFLSENILAQQEAKINYVAINDSTVYCFKKDDEFLLQFKNGKIKDKQKFINFFNVKEDNDTLQWNNIVSNVENNQIIPDVSLYVQYKVENNPDSSFIWFVKRNNELRQFKILKETNFLVDPIISFIAGKDLASDSAEYKNI